MPWVAGQRLQGGKYIIEEVLGQGGFGITYKASRIIRGLSRLVVIKTPNEYLSYDPEYEKYINQFTKEGQMLARLSQQPHPHIVGVIEVFQEGSIYCIVMDFIPGEDLFKAVRHRGALPEAEIVPCIRQIGEALMVVHQAGLVHRDAHPGNIMRRNNGKAVLIDFGIAKELIPKTLSSTSHAGNHGFAPYEQITRGTRKPTVDIYCLAATLYYAVTGQSPTTSLARKLDNASLIPPKSITSISNKLNKAILKGMALEAKDRPQSIREWLKMLEAAKVTPPRIIPWGWLVGVLLSYLFIGYLPHWFISLHSQHRTFLPISYFANWTLAMVLAWNWEFIDWNFNRNGNNYRYLLMICSSIGLTNLNTIFRSVVIRNTFGLQNRNQTRSWHENLTQGWVFPILLSVIFVNLVGSWPIRRAGEGLQKSFSKIHTFLILASTSSLGLVLGWFIFVLLFNNKA